MWRICMLKHWFVRALIDSAERVGGDYEESSFGRDGRGWYNRYISKSESN